jgi:hypothetical protein
MYISNLLFLNKLQDSGERLCKKMCKFLPFSTNISLGLDQSILPNLALILGGKTGSARAHHADSGEDSRSVFLRRGITLVLALTLASYHFSVDLGF